VEERKIVYAAVLNAAMQPLVWHTLVGKYKHPFYPTLTCFYSGVITTCTLLCLDLAKKIPVAPFIQRVTLFVALADTEISIIATNAWPG
jgi:hypothetical protein